MAGAKEDILKKIRTALNNKVFKAANTPVAEPQNVYITSNDSKELIFAQEFTKINGHFVFCENVNELHENLQLFLKEKKLSSVYCIDPALQSILMDAGIAYNTGAEEFKSMNVAVTGCEHLVARTGSIVVSSSHISGRKINFYPHIHLVIAASSQIVNDLDDALTSICHRYSWNLPSMLTVVTGPSRTADIEKTLVLGAHGPRELFVFLIHNQ